MVEQLNSLQRCCLHMVKKESTCNILINYVKARKFLDLVLDLFGFQWVFPKLVKLLL